jgi:glycerol-3-phosphate dehydrogenase
VWRSLSPLSSHPNQSQHAPKCSPTMVYDDARPYPLKFGYDGGYRTGEAGYFGGPPMLTDVQARKAKAADRPYKLTDGGGLHVCVTPAGGKLWRLRYEFKPQGEAALDRSIPFGRGRRSARSRHQRKVPSPGGQGPCRREAAQAPVNASDWCHQGAAQAHRTDTISLSDQRHALRPASENAIGYLLNRAAYHHRHVPHGMARNILDRHE